VAPRVPGIGEVLHAHFTEHAYPAHTHDRWTVLLVDTGGVSYDLHRETHRAAPGSLTLLPPHVPHNGKSASATGFDKRVLDLDERCLPLGQVGSAVERPTIDDDGLRKSVDLLHRVLATPGDELEAETQLAFVGERLTSYLDYSIVEPRLGREPQLARRVRDLLDRNLTDVPTLKSMALDFDIHPTQLIRAFTREHGLPPHRYVTGRRVDLARRLLLAGMPAADVAAHVGFHDQAHLTRHFRKTLGVTPAAYVR
jgi:AraC-like DNA-binding protein